MRSIQSDCETVAAIMISQLNGSYCLVIRNLHKYVILIITFI
jgi:hypothetical protein